MEEPLGEAQEESMLQEAVQDWSAQNHFMKKKNLVMVGVGAAARSVC